jgi:putative endonuclease
MKSQNKETGRLGEDLATKFLEAKGYKILDRNYSTKFGELDIIARDGETLVFVEVKTKTSDQFGSPEEMITPHKLHQIQNTAQSYLLSRPSPFTLPSSRVQRSDPGSGLPRVYARNDTFALRIDAICINLETKTIKHYENISG